MNWQDHIERRKGVCMGKPVFKGTRLTVEFVIERLSDGASEEDLLRNYVGLDHNSIRAALAYATAVLRSDEAYLQF